MHAVSSTQPEAGNIPLALLHEPTHQTLEQSQRGVLIRIIRLIFAILIVTFTTIAFYQAWSLSKEANQVFWLPVAIAALIIVVVVGIDKLTPVKRISSIVGVLVGLLFGLLAALMLGALADLLLQSWTDRQVFDQYQPMIQSIKIIVGICLGYLGVITVLQTQDDFRLVIPYIEFAKQIRGVRPILLDSSALIDGRIADIAATRFIQGSLVVPQFVVRELQALADSADVTKRAKGRRGLDMISRLQRQATVDVSIDETPVPDNAVDQMLVDLARTMPAMILTTDTGLARVANIQGALALNLNELANAAKINLAPGEMLSVKVMREGEQPGQGVGYMPDGTMIVLEDGEGFMGKHVNAVVTSSLQTSAGRLIFARIGTDAPPRREDIVAPVAESRSLPISLGVAQPIPTTDNQPEQQISADELRPVVSCETAAAETSSSRSPQAPHAPNAPHPLHTPHPPRPPTSIRQGTPRNPRR